MGEFPKTNRQEASSIPHLLVAPRSGPQLPSHPDDGPVDRSIYDDGRGDARGYYHDGAYTAAPDPDDDDAADHTTTTTTTHDPHQAQSPPSRALSDAYFASLSAQFLALRLRLHQPPPPAVVAALPASSSPAVGPLGGSSRTFAVWSARLGRADPRPAQVAAMPKDAVLRVLRVLLGGRLLRRGAPVAERTSRWLWALLARLPDRGEMDHVEVGHVRELGKRAALLLWSLREMALLREEVEGRGGDDDDDEDEEEEEAEEVEQLGAHADGAGEEAWVGGDDNVDEAVSGEDEKGTEKHDGAGTGGVTAGRPQGETPAQPTSDPDPEPESEPTPMLSSTVPTSTPSVISADPIKPTDDDDDDMEDGEIPDTSVPMDLEPEAGNPGAALEAARARLLANLNGAATTGTDEDNNNNQSVGKDAETEKESEPGPEQEDLVRARMNARVTLNMILTVAGEFYGQRDLLEFRDLFHGVAANGGTHAA